MSDPRGRSDWYMRDAERAAYEASLVAAEVMFKTSITLPKMRGVAEVVTVDWTVPGYELCGFETVTTLPDGDQWGNGPETDDETPLGLHLYAVQHLAENYDVGRTALTEKLFGP